MVGLVMKKELRHRIYGTTIEQWISLVPGELPIDAVGLWQIVPAGPAAILHRPAPIIIVAAPSFMVELAYAKLPF